MAIRQLIAAYLSCGATMLALDAVWLSTMADRLYRPAIGHLMAERFSLVPALLFYVIYVAGMVYFAVIPALSLGRWQVAAERGAVLGLLAYATYDLTNQATLTRWPWLVTFADIAWGTFLTAFAAAVGCLVTLKWGGRLGDT